MLSPIFSDLNEKIMKNQIKWIYFLSSETKVCIDDKSICFYYKKWAGEGDIE